VPGKRCGLRLRIGIVQLKRELRLRIGVVQFQRELWLWLPMRM
jgi:hypothetical protein